MEKYAKGARTTIIWVTMDSAFLVYKDNSTIEGLRSAKHASLKIKRNHASALMTVKLAMEEHALRARLAWDGVEI